MSPDEFRAALASLGLNQSAAARALATSRRNVVNWASGTIAVPGPVRVLLGLALTCPAAGERLRVMGALRSTPRSER